MAKEGKGFQRLWPTSSGIFSEEIERSGWKKCIKEIEVIEVEIVRILRFGE